MKQIVVNGTDIFYRGTEKDSLCHDISGSGVWFSDNKLYADTYAEEGYIVTARLRAKKPVYFSANKEGYNRVPIPNIETKPKKAKKVLLDYLQVLKDKHLKRSDDITLSTDEIWKALQKKGYDAVIITDIYEGHAPKYNIQTVTDVAVLSVENVIEISRVRKS